MLISKTWRIVFEAIIWLIVFLFPLLSYNVEMLDPHFYLKECIHNGFLIGLFYFHMNFLIARYFVRSKLGVYLVFVLVAVGVVCTEQYLVEYASYKAIAAARSRPLILPLHGAVPGHIHTLTGADSARPYPGIGVFDAPNGQHGETIFRLPAFLFFRLLRKSLFSALFILFASGFIRIALELFKTERQRGELEKEKRNAELGFLKSQVNPHFLFNALNSIYSLAHRKAAETETAILQLAQMMRYLIYESNTSQVPLYKEIEYLENYIQLKKLRLPPAIHIHYQVMGDAAGCYVKPTLLIPFVENAFKHGISYAGHSDITIVLTITGQHQLHLLVSNRIIKQENHETGGIGLENVQKRLQLLYPRQHTLEINQADNYYTTSLTIALKNSAHA